MNRFIIIVLAFGLQCFTLFDETSGHGMMLQPAGRSSLWRFDESALVNYNDNANYCGGYTVQYNVNGGKCGLCGDDYRDPAPRDNELGGLYGRTGILTDMFEYTSKDLIGFNITTNHLGYVFLEICSVDEFGEESEECFAKHRLKFDNGSDKFFVGSRTGWFDIAVILPNNLSCEHCVLRWTYYAGNNWRNCEDGTGALGCGEQETFKSCADIRIKVGNK